MADNTVRFHAPQRIALAALLLLSCLLAHAPAHAGKADGAHAVPAQIAIEAPRLAGEGTFRWFGLRIYDAQLWVATGRFDRQDPLAGPLALSLTYARSLSGQRIAESSTDEIRNLEIASAEQLGEWDTRMKAIFPDVNDGDRLVGHFDADGATRFVLNGEPIGTVEDPAFGRAFFAIWLDERTSAPDLRTALLGQNADNKP